MPTVSVNSSFRNPAFLEWLPVAAGLLIMYVPTFYHLSTWHWQQDDYAHGPIILAVIAWLLYDKREALLTTSREGNLIAGLFFLLSGLLLYVLGRSQEMTTLEVGSLLPTLLGVFLTMRGWRALRAYWFMLLFLMYLVPPPGVFMDTVSAALKPHISSIATQGLYVAGYPVAQDGVIMLVGPYRLLVADACSGLNSLFSISAVGMLYLYLMSHKSWLRNGLILASLLPIAFLANILRVVTLALITYHFGDAAAQGFLHGFSGMLLFVVALTAVLLIDAVLGYFLERKQATA